MATKPRLIYRPSPAHKVETTEAGPPVWRPDKEKCPARLSIAESQQLVDDSFPASGDERDPRRFAVRRASAEPEFYESKYSLTLPDGGIVVHGHPTRRVPPAVLRRMRDAERISQAEYNRLRKVLC